MICSYGATVFFGIAVLSLYGGALLWKKEEERASILEWAVLLMVLLGCYHTFAAAVLDIVHIPVNIWSVGVCDLIPAAFFWYAIVRKKNVQRYEFRIPDAVFLIILAAAVAVFAKIHYGGSALLVNYISIDAGVHFRTALDVVRSQTIANMFHDTVWNALLIEFLGSFTTVDYYYRLYVLGELINLALSAAVFYALIRRYMKGWFSWIAGIFLSMVYLAAYPVNSALFGFSYLGMSVTVIAMLMALTDFFLHDKIPKWFGIAGMMLGCLALFESYVLFMPVTFFAILFCIFRKQWKQKRLISRDTVIICLAVFLIPCLIGLWYTYRGIFTGGVTVSTALANEGGCYRELYSNFLFFLPAAALGYVGLIKRKENRLLVFLTPLFLVFTLVMFIRTLNGSTSSYYYYKLYFPIWLVLLILNFYGVIYAAAQTRVVIASVAGVWCMLAVFFLGSVEERIQIHNPLLVPAVRSVGYMDILSFNYTYLYVPGYPPDRIDLYHYVYQELLAKGEECVPGVISYEDNFWFQDITDQRYWDWDYYSMDNGALDAKLRESGAGYVVVLYSSPLYTADQAYYDALERVYENGAGFVAKLVLKD